MIMLLAMVKHSVAGTYICDKLWMLEGSVRMLTTTSQPVQAVFSERHIAEQKINRQLFTESRQNSNYAECNRAIAVRTCNAEDVLARSNAGMHRSSCDALIC